MLYFFWSRVVYRFVPKNQPKLTCGVFLNVPSLSLLTSSYTLLASLERGGGGGTKTPTTPAHHDQSACRLWIFLQFLNNNLPAPNVYKLRCRCMEARCDEPLRGLFARNTSTALPAHQCDRNLAALRLGSAIELSQPLAQHVKLYFIYFENEFKGALSRHSVIFPPFSCGEK